MTWELSEKASTIGIILVFFGIVIFAWTTHPSYQPMFTQATLQNKHADWLKEEGREGDGEGGNGDRGGMVQ